ncbi:MAG: lytic transglycosylase domain-containing protein [Alphaproteobacteria bacterium]|nr:lytic transglycosylase domain-containing protein [Alphaproteobacteria bacterium]
MTQIASDIIIKYQDVAPRGVIKAVQVAAERTGANFAYLMEKAAAESGFDTKAAARTSSAKGLFQFIESTWLHMVKTHGPKHGLGKMAAQIEIKNGKPCVADCDVKEDILRLRKNPAIAAIMAGEYSAENAAYLEKATGRAPGETELYMAHFMGAGGAAKFLNRMERNPDTRAADLFPRAARANRNVFFDRTTGRAKSLGDIYRSFAKKFGQTVNTPSSLPPKVASNGGPAGGVLPLQDTSARQAAPSFHGVYKMADIVWNDSPRVPQFTSETLFRVAEMAQERPSSGFTSRRDKFGYNA